MKLQGARRRSSRVWPIPSSLWKGQKSLLFFWHTFIPSPKGDHQRLWVEPEREQRVNRNGCVPRAKYIGINNKKQKNQISKAHSKNAGPQLPTKRLGRIRREQVGSEEQVRPRETWHEQGFHSLFRLIIWFKVFLKHTTNIFLVHFRVFWKYLALYLNVLIPGFYLLLGF